MRVSPIHLAAAAAPALVTLALVRGLFGAAPGDFVPWWNDEVVYWNEIAAFARAGFDAGYVTVHEQPPPAAFSRSGPHGPVFSVLYGLPARAIGWRPHTGFLLNLLIIPAAALVWFRVRRTAHWTELLLPVIFWPLLLLLPTNMQEPVHFAIAFLLAAATWLLLEGRTRSWWWAGPLLVIAALARPTWALMILPLGVVHLHGRSGARGRIELTLAAATSLVAAQQVFAYVSAPYPASVAYVSAENAGVLSEVATAPGRVWARTRATVGPFLDRENGDPSEVALRYVAVALSLLLLALWLVTHKREYSLSAPGSAPARRRGSALIAATLALVLPLVLVLATGYIEGFRDFRILSPHLLYALLVAGAVAPLARAAWWVTLFATPVYLQSFVDLHRERFHVGTSEIAAVERALSPVLRVDPAAAGWANTLLVHADLLRYPLLGVPAGISLSYVIDWDDQAVPFRSRYVLLRPEDRAALGGRTAHLELLAEVPLGTLYLNRAATTR
jgi:hypothetical protein